MSYKPRDDDVEPVGGRPAPTEYGDVEPVGWSQGDRPVRPIGRDDPDAEPVR